MGHLLDHVHSGVTYVRLTGAVVTTTPVDLDDKHLHIVCEVPGCTLSMPNGTDPIVGGGIATSRLHIHDVDIVDTCRGIDVSDIDALTIENAKFTRIGWNGTSATTEDA